MYCFVTILCISQTILYKYYNTYQIMYPYIQVVDSELPLVLASKVDKIVEICLLRWKC